MSKSLRERIEIAWNLADTTFSEDVHDDVNEVLRLLTEGAVRAADRGTDGQWRANEWVKKAILLHFRLTVMKPTTAGAFEYHDKLAIQGEWQRKNVRVVPPATARYGAHLSPGVILMPSYINIGAWVGPGTMIDTWSTVGSCAQVGANCHISGGVGIGGVLEPLQGRPVIIEDDCFIGARSEVAEGVIVREGAVLAMGSYLGASTRIYDATKQQLAPMGEIPARAVVVPGSTPSKDGSHSTYTLIIKKFRDARTDARTALNDALR